MSTHPPAPRSLYEALAWQPGVGYLLLAEHLQRLSRSARYFGVPVDLDRVAEGLLGYTIGLDTPAKVRLEVDRTGTFRIGHQPRPASAPVTLGLASVPVHRDDIFLRHKTSERGVYARASAAHPNVDDVILYNERGELTETTRCNLVLELADARLTPALSAGLLPGTFREHLLCCGRIAEARLTTADLPRATRLWVINSVRQWCDATWIRTTT